MKGGLCFFVIDSCFFLVLAPGGFVASVASTVLAPGGSWWLLVAPLAPGGYCGFRGSCWLLVASVASMALGSYSSSPPMAHLSSIGNYQSIYR